MTATALSFGPSALLRLAGCPIQFWLAAANPDLFSIVRKLNQTQDTYSTLGVRLAEHLGTELVPHPALSSPDRALVLSLRRQFHNGFLISETEYQRLLRITRRVLAPSTCLVRELEQAARYSGELALLKTTAAKGVIQERERLPRLAWELIQSSPVAEALLRNRNPEVYSAVAESVRRGASWESKHLKTHSDYIWQMIDRASTKSTPRDWHAHVGLLSICSSASAPPSLVVENRFATEWMENIHSLRIELSHRPLEQADLQSHISVTPLHWQQNDHLSFWVVDPTDLSMGELLLRRTLLLDIIYTTLRPGPATRDELEAQILRTRGECSREVLRKFVEHLIGLGVLQVSPASRGRLVAWHRVVTGSVGERKSNTDQALPISPPVNALPAGGRLPAEDHARRNGYLDVYRRMVTPLPVSSCMRLQQLVQQALRVLTLVATDRVTAARTLPVPAGDQPRPLLELLKSRVEADETTHSHRTRPSDWPPALTSGSRYARLLEWMAAKADESTVLDISQPLLDEFGAPEGVINWPIDCVLRVPCGGAGYEAVLDEIRVAGSMDARFITTLRMLHGHVPHADAYHEFLERLEQASGTTFVEVLIPPLSEGAANAVRRPLYTRAWTGDASIHTYCTLDGSMPTYIPLNAITLRRTDRGLVAEVGGAPICPMYHATRSPLPPWDLLAETLLSTALLPIRWFPHPLHHLFKAFPDRSFMPRITVATDLVLSCAQWRVTPDRLWAANDSVFVKVRALERLRRELRLPRWIRVSSQSGIEPLPCDLESLRAIRTFERVARVADSKILLVEMLPSPDQLLVSDHAHCIADRSVSELLLRLPCDESPSAMATRLAPDFSRASSH